MKRRVEKTGLCKLTSTNGKFVKSHLIPRALTPPREGGEPFPEFGMRRRPTRRLDSWYDDQLVTQAGEDILTALDTHAIEEFRRLKLVWQSFGPMVSLATKDFRRFPMTDNGIRIIRFQDPGRIRLFFLSLLWRAAATMRPEFSEVMLRASELRRVRAIVRDGNTDVPWGTYPVTLTQVTTRGAPHNHSPMYQVKAPFEVEGVRSKPLPMFRFYMDGLIAHIHLPVDDEILDGLWPMVVGRDEPTAIGTVDWDGSWQRDNLALTIADAEHEFPGAIERIDDSAGRKRK